MIPPYTWDELAARYRDGRGRFVAREEIRSALDWAIERVQQRMLSTGEELRAGKMGLDVWRSTMATELKSLHLYSAAAARGGWGKMAAGDYGRVGRILRDQYRYLDGFAADVASGKQPLDGRFISRVKLYAQSGRVTYHAEDDALMAESGMTEERNVLDDSAESCDDCIEETGWGWVPIGTLSPIGSRTCRSNDRCSKEFRGPDGKVGVASARRATNALRKPWIGRPSSDFPAANAEGEDTLRRFMHADGTLTPERQKLHDAIVRSYLSGKDRVRAPIVNVMGGGPASGKSVLLSRMEKVAGAVHIDVDEIRTLIPEYNEMVTAGQIERASPFVHEEASMLAKRVAAETIKGSYNAIIDGTGDSGVGSLAKKVASWRASGAERIVANYVTVDTETALTRSLQRMRETGRAVPVDFLRLVHADVSRTFPAAIEKGLFDEFVLWDTNGPTPIKVVSGTLDHLIIHDQAAWTRFLAKATEALP